VFAGGNALPLASIRQQFDNGTSATGNCNLYYAVHQNSIVSGSGLPQMDLLMIQPRKPNFEQICRTRNGGMFLAGGALLSI
jgi:hypothetical protein